MSSFKNSIFLFLTVILGLLLLYPTFVLLGISATLSRYKYQSPEDLLQISFQEIMLSRLSLGLVSIIIMVTFVRRSKEQKLNNWLRFLGIFPLILVIYHAIMMH